MSASIRPRWIACSLLAGLLACGHAAPRAAETTAFPAAAGTRRAVLVGIDDYSASRLPPAGSGAQRSVPDLEGAVNDVREVRDMLVARYGFAPRDVVTLTDQAATRAAIFGALDEHLLRPARPGDVVLFYFSGHGSQVVNSLSEEPDKLDESIVPADWARGAPDVRDKELRRVFNRILDRGARLNVVLDSCHSGSGARGYPADARFRSAPPDLQDVKDGSPAGPIPEDRGALVLAATQDFDLAWETRDERDQPHGAFSLALLRAMRDATAGEPAIETFRRARARLQAEKRFQEPLLAGDAEVRRSPFLGGRAAEGSGGRIAVAVEQAGEHGIVILQGGWADGLTPGSELRLLPPAPPIRLRVTEILGPSRSEAVVLPAAGPATAPRPGALAAISAWAPAPGTPLRVWLSTAPGTNDPAAALAAKLAGEASHHGVRWIVDPTAATPAWVLRWREQSWELAGVDGRRERLGPAPDAASVLARIVGGKGVSLFVQIPLPGAALRSLDLVSGATGVEVVADPGAADYVLAGRLTGRDAEYAWLRPGVGPSDQRRTGLPLRSAWHPLGDGKDLRAALGRLRRIHAWNHLESPAGAGFPYELALRRAGEVPVVNGPLVSGERYSLVLRAKPGLQPQATGPRYVYAFLIDSYGRGVLLFPADGNGPVANRFPPEPAPQEIPLAGSDSEVTAPYGADTYFLLTSDEPLPDPWILEWDGVRDARSGSMAPTPLEDLLLSTGAGIRSARRLPTPPSWSIEKKWIESVPPAHP
jgi:hypothetical protein